jgi:hypothetical protein
MNIDQNSQRIIKKQQLNEKMNLNNMMIIGKNWLLQQSAKIFE